MRIGPPEQKEGYETGMTASYQGSASTEDLMTRTLLTLLLALLIAGGFSGCNPTDPTGPKSFSIFDIDGVWKFQMENEGCGPGKFFFMEFARFGVALPPDSAQFSGGWYLDQKNPDTFDFKGYIFHKTGLAFFTLDIQDSQIVEGVFTSSRRFSGAYREVGGCVNRLQGKFLE